MVNRLMAYKAAAQMNARRKDGSTALHVAIGSRQKDNIKQDVSEALMGGIADTGLE